MKMNLLRTEIACLAMAVAFLISLVAPIRAQEVGVAPVEAGVAPISGMEMEAQSAQLLRARPLPAFCPFPITRPISGHVSTSLETGGVPAPISQTKAFRSAWN